MYVRCVRSGREMCVRFVREERCASSSYEGSVGGGGRFVPECGAKERCASDLYGRKGGREGGRAAPSSCRRRAPASARPPRSAAGPCASAYLVLLRRVRPGTTTALPRALLGRRPAKRRAARPPRRGAASCGTPRCARPPRLPRRITGELGGGNMGREGSAEMAQRAHRCPRRPGKCRATPPAAEAKS